MAIPHKRETKRPIGFPEHGPTLIDLRPPKFAEGTPAPWTQRPKLDPPPPGVTMLKAHNPAALTLRPAQRAMVIDVVPRDAVMQAVARIEAARGEGTGHHLVKASAAMPVQAPARWAEYGEMGLAPLPSKAVSTAARLAVSSYRLLGFAILTLIVVVLVGYIATTAFYFFSKSWVMPTVVSASDDKVVQLQTELATQQNQHDKLASDLDDAERAIIDEQAFQLAFVQAIKSDLAGRQATLDKVKQLAVTAASTRNRVRATNDEYAAQSSERMAAEYDAHLIDRQAMLAGKFQLAQITSANLSLAERQSEFETRARELGDATRSLDAILENKDASAPLSYDVLKIKRDYDASKLALARFVENREVLRASLARQDKIIAGIAKSAYLRAVTDQAAVAVVPYDNLGGVAKGTKLFGCKVGMVMCHQVGSVVEVLPGEVTFKHPHRDLQMRGKMIELHVDDVEAAQHDVLFIGSAPLWF